MIMIMAVVPRCCSPGGAHPNACHDNLQLLTRAQHLEAQRNAGHGTGPPPSTTAMHCCGAKWARMQAPAEAGQGPAAAATSGCHTFKEPRPADYLVMPAQPAVPDPGQAAQHLAQQARCAVQGLARQQQESAALPAGWTPQLIMCVPSHCAMQVVWDMKAFSTETLISMPCHARLSPFKHDWRQDAAYHCSEPLPDAVAHQGPSDFSH